MKPNDLKPRREPQQARAQQTVDVVFEGMIDAIARHERGDPTVQFIADRAGVSVGSIYQYFPTKASLVNGLLRFHLRARMDELEAALESAAGLPAEQAAERLVAGLLAEKHARSKLEAGLTRYFMRAGDVATLTEMDERMLGLVRRFIASLGDQVRAVDLDTAAFLVSNALRSAVLLSVLQKPERLASEGFKRELVYLVVSYLRPAG